MLAGCWDKDGNVFFSPIQLEPGVPKTIHQSNMLGPMAKHANFKIKKIRQIVCNLCASAIWK